MTRVIAILATVVCITATGGAAASTDVFPIFPQAGIVWKDLYPTNFVDLDPAPGLRDYACGTQTYDGHTGSDTIVRSFREMDIGVPVFAALDGEVISVQDGFFDREHGPTISRFDNHVVLQHGTGRFTIYGHLRKGIASRRGDRVVAGQQLGWTASSGSSTWPHLHFTSQVDSLVVEPFAGPCREGESGWAEQAPWPTEPYARDVAISAKPFRGRALLPWDEAERTGTFVRGTRRDLPARRARSAMSPTQRRRGAAPAAGRLGRRRRRVVTATVPPGPGRDLSLVSRQLQLGRPVAARGLAREGRREGADPRRGEAGLGAQPPAEPDPEAMLVPTVPPQCRLTTSLVTEDPDTDIVSYRYGWTVDGRGVRTVDERGALATSSVATASARARRLACGVTPSDGRLAGPTRYGRRAAVQVTSPDEQLKAVSPTENFMSNRAVPVAVVPENVPRTAISNVAGLPLTVPGPEYA